MKKSAVAVLALAPLFSLAAAIRQRYWAFARVDSFRLSLGYSPVFY